MPSILALSVPTNKPTAKLCISLAIELMKPVMVSIRYLLNVVFILTAVAVTDVF